MDLLRMGRRFWRSVGVTLRKGLLVEDVVSV